ARTSGKVAEHYNQATLFYDSQTAWERKHIIDASRSSSAGDVDRERSRIARPFIAAACPTSPILLPAAVRSRREWTASCRFRSR
ncbi:hypothetical protein CTI14_51490, partial [Methylobacterium radiotolerans]